MPTKNQKEKRKERTRQRLYEKLEKIREFGTSVASEVILMKREGRVSAKEEAFLEELVLKEYMDLSPKQEHWLSRLFTKYGFSLNRKSNGKLVLVDRGMSKQERKNAQQIYLIECNKASAMKIGIAVNPKGRLGELQVGNPFPLKLAKTYQLPSNTKNASKVEVMLHNHFNSKRMRGEWFHELDVNQVEVALGFLNIEYE